MKSLLMPGAAQRLGHVPPQAQYEDAVDGRDLPVAPLGWTQNGFRCEVRTLH